MQNQFTIPEESSFARHTLEVESLLCGEWRNLPTHQRWLFLPIKQNDRYGRLQIFKANESEPIKFGYEVVWVRAGLVFLNLLRATIDLLEQYHIDFENTNILKITPSSSAIGQDTEAIILRRLSHDR